MDKHGDENEANKLCHGYAVKLFGNHEQFLMVGLLLWKPNHPVFRQNKNLCQLRKTGITVEPPLTELRLTEVSVNRGNNVV